MNRPLSFWYTTAAAFWLIAQVLILVWWGLSPKPIVWAAALAPTFLWGVAHVLFGMLMAGAIVNEKVTTGTWPFEDCSE